MSLAIFLPNLEVSIVSTSLIAIANDLQGFSHTAWIVVAYLITYTGGFVITTCFGKGCVTNFGHDLTYDSGFIIIWAKLSDILMRKWSLIASLAIFIGASAVCGGAQTMTMLSVFLLLFLSSTIDPSYFCRIVFRSLQGIGAAGCFSISMIVFFELIPREKYPKYGSIISADIALATLLGPLLGGIITDTTTWRWVFLIK